MSVALIWSAWFPTFTGITRWTMVRMHNTWSMRISDNWNYFLPLKIVSSICSTFECKLLKKNPFHIWLLRQRKVSFLSKICVLRYYLFVGESLKLCSNNIKCCCCISENISLLGSVRLLRTASSAGSPYNYYIHRVRSTISNKQKHFEGIDKHYFWSNKQGKLILENLH